MCYWRTFRGVERILTSNAALNWPRESVHYHERVTTTTVVVVTVDAITVRPGRAVDTMAWSLSGAARRNERWNGKWLYVLCEGSCFVLYKPTYLIFIYGCLLSSVTFRAYVCKPAEMLRYSIFFCCFIRTDFDVILT